MDSTPKNQFVYIDKLGKDQGYSSLYKLKIEEYITFKDFMYSLFSLGFYTPRTFKISASGTTKNDPELL